MRIILVVGLILVVLDLNEVRIYCVGIKGQRDDSVDGSGLGNELECP